MNYDEQDQQLKDPSKQPEEHTNQEHKLSEDKKEYLTSQPSDTQTQSTITPTHVENESSSPTSQPPSQEGRPIERNKTAVRQGARGTAAMDPKTRQEVARKGGLAVSRNKQHMAEIGRKGGQSVSKNREHMAQIGRKGGAASRGHR